MGSPPFALPYVDGDIVGQFMDSEAVGDRDDPARFAQSGVAVGNGELLSRLVRLECGHVGWVGLVVGRLVVIAVPLSSLGTSRVCPW